MDKYLKKTDEKKTERTTKDRGDLKMSLLNKVIEDLDIKDFLPQIRDRGDSKANYFKTMRMKIAEKQQRLKVYRESTEKKKIDEIVAKTTLSTLKKEDNKASIDNDERGGTTRKEQNAKVAPKAPERKKLEESKAKTTTGQDVTAKIEDNGDSGQLLQKIPKANADKGKLDDGAKAKNPLPRKDSKNCCKDEAPIKTYLNLEGRKHLRQKYTVKLKSSQNSSKNIDIKAENVEGNAKNDECEIKKQASDKISDKEKSNGSTKDSGKSETTKPAGKRSKDPTTVQRKPIIKTIRLSNDNRVYKAVTFTDEKKPTQLQIKIPNNDCKRSKKSVESNTIISQKIKANASKVSMKPIKKTKEKNSFFKRRVHSPLISTNNSSPPTEVAKWAPSCLSRQTKPYYEAWVDTTLAAITKCTENEKRSLGKQNLIQTFKRVLNARPRTPELIYEKSNDERYTGKITVRQSTVK